MKGHEHYREAERLRERAVEAQNAGYDGSERGWQNAAYYNAAAHVHATLALAAASSSTVSCNRWGEEG